MSFTAINPVTGQIITQIPVWDDTQLDAALTQVAAATPNWAATPLHERCTLIHKAGQILRDNIDEYARLISQEMGKLIVESRAEIEKCASACDYYAENSPSFLKDEIIQSDASKSYVSHQPLGTILAIMPWNFPFWQVFRFAIPTLIAGNTGVLKHASNVPECALAIEKVFQLAGFPTGVFRSLMIKAPQVQKLIEDPRIHAITLTGSESAGRQVAATAGACLKKVVLELGGSDAFIVLEDADLDAAAHTAVTSRFLNAGQSCIAAKRFIVVDAIADDFISRFKAEVEKLQPGDPFNDQSSLAPMARIDIRDELHQQVTDSLAAGAIAITGCKAIAGAGAFYSASIIDQVKPGVRAYNEELFGPVASIIRAQDEQDAIRIANDSPFGLGGSIWTHDQLRGEHLARQIESGATFINGLVKSDPRLPFGGIKNSGFGRELSHHGIKEFVNAKTIWIK